MNRERLAALLAAVADGETSIDEALDELRGLPFRDLGYAKLDTHRPLRTGHPEVVFGSGKTPEQLAGIVEGMAGAGHPVLVTRLAPDGERELRRRFPAARFDGEARAMVLEAGVEGDERAEHATAAPPAEQWRAGDAMRRAPKKVGGRQDVTVGVAVLCAGTSDIPVAAEAALTAEVLGSSVQRHWDVGVAGLQRVLSVRDELDGVRAVVVVAGMEGALPSVVGGLVPVPVIAVPTSVGYGASYGGLAALLGMLNSCAPGVSVVNIDNGFGAGYLAHLIDSAAGTYRKGSGAFHRQRGGTDTERDGEDR